MKSYARAYVRTSYGEGEPCNSFRFRLKDATKYVTVLRTSNGVDTSTDSSRRLLPGKGAKRWERRGNPASAYELQEAFDRINDKCRLMATFCHVVSADVAPGDLDSARDTHSRIRGTMPLLYILYIVTCCASRGLRRRCCCCCCSLRHCNRRQLTLLSLAPNRKSLDVHFATSGRKRTTGERDRTQPGTNDPHPNGRRQLQNCKCTNCECGWTAFGTEGNSATICMPSSAAILLPVNNEIADLLSRRLAYCSQEIRRGECC
jgi:hypothetical protein